MCGIAGGFGLRLPAIDAMVSGMAHRGPDDSGIFRSGDRLLGMTRLAIIDIGAGGHQPMVWGENEVALVFNGEIYNHRILRCELEARGRRFVSHSDTEVVLQLYLEHGEGFVTRLKGMFAIAVYDRRGGHGREKLLLARDQLGIKPLVFSRIEGGIVFASEIRSLLASGLVPVRLNPEAVRQLLVRGAVSQPATILSSVEMLMPGHLMTVTAAGIRTEQFWRMATSRRPEISRLSYLDQVAAVRSELERIVAEQLVADVPLGAFLSGGLDSSLLVAMMAARKSDPIRTFSIGFGGEGADLDETADSALVAKYLGTHHSRVEIGEDDVANGLPAFVQALGQPSVDGLNSWFVSGICAADVKVAISGTGGDELFAGYPWFRLMNEFVEGPKTVHRGGVSGFLRKVLGRASGAPQGMDQSEKDLFEKDLPERFVAHFAAQYRHFNPSLASDLLGQSAQAVLRGDVEDLGRADTLRDADVLGRTSALCLNSYTLNQLLRDIDGTSMAHSLEVRVPFLDPDLADLALSLPVESRLGPESGNSANGSYRALGTKRILLDVAAGLLPDELGSRPKRGFSMPLDRWLRGKLRPVLEDTVRSLSSDVAAIIDQKSASRTVDRFLKGEAHWGQPWLLMILDLWSRSVANHSSRAALEVRRIPLPQPAPALHRQ